MDGIALLRTEGKAFTNGATLDPARFALLPTLLRASKTDQTRDVERDFALGDCLYFFAGHACPDFGDVVLVYEPDMADADQGGATPFDTGGLHAGFIHCAPALAQEDRAGYCRSHARALSAWREDARRYLEQYFETDRDYMLGKKPVRDDPSGRLAHPDNSRRAWTWEVRLHRDHHIAANLRRVWMSSDYYESLRQHLLLASGNGAACATLLQDGTVKQADPLCSPHLMAEGEVASWV